MILSRILFVLCFRALSLKLLLSVLFFSMVNLDYSYSPVDRGNLSILKAINELVKRGLVIIL